MKKGRGRYYKTEGGNYVYLPAKLVDDSTFPLKPGDIAVSIRGRKVVIEQA